MNRRGFLTAILIGSAAPAIVRADSLMKIAAPKILAIDDYLQLPTYLYMRVGGIWMFSGACEYMAGDSEHPLVRISKDGQQIIVRGRKNERF
jgi:hypothetical protein